jgi:regulatory protein
MKITKIERQRSGQKKVNIHADGEYLIGIHVETLVRFGLRVGDSLTKEHVRRIEEAEGLLAARSSALRLLATRPRTERELFERLRQKEYSEDQIAAVLGEFKKSGLVNDDEFARMFVRNALAVRPVGRIVLKRRMLLLGISPALADLALAEVLEPAGEGQYAAEAAAKFLKKIRPGKKKDDEQQRRQKLTAFLLRRGYPWTVVEPVVRSAMNGEKTGGEENMYDEREGQ